MFLVYVFPSRSRRFFNIYFKPLSPDLLAFSRLQTPGENIDPVGAVFPLPYHIQKIYLVDTCLKGFCSLTSKHVPTLSALLPSCFVVCTISYLPAKG